jgi:Ca2+-binding EF-hand superfamily protein
LLFASSGCFFIAAIKKMCPCSQVEEILRNKIKDNWQSVSNAFIHVDTNRDGHLSRVELRRLLERYCLPLTEEHFEM